jgi:hypothetical protein
MAAPLEQDIDKSKPLCAGHSFAQAQILDRITKIAKDVEAE